jgi:hypothetical protein
VAMSSELETGERRSESGGDARGPLAMGSASVLEPRALFGNDPFAFCAWLAGPEHPLGGAIGLLFNAPGPPRPSLGELAWSVGGMEPGDRPLLLVASLHPITTSHLGALLVLLARAGDGQAVVVAPTFSSEALDVLRWVAAIASPSRQLRLLGVGCRFVSVDGSRPAPLLETVFDTAETAEAHEPSGQERYDRTSLPSTSAEPSKPGGDEALVLEPGQGPARASSAATAEAASELWSSYLAWIQEHHPDWRVVDRSATRCILEPPGRDVTVITEALPGFRLRASLVLGPTSAPEQAEARFGRLEAARGAFEQAFGGALAWEALPLRGVYRISDYAAGDPSQLEEQADYVRFLGGAAERLVDAFDSVLGPSAGAS